MSQPHKRAEFGDFQTPEGLATGVCRLLATLGLSPRSVVEPSCGVGNFLVAALNEFPALTRVLAVDIESRYVRAARDRLRAAWPSGASDIRIDDFFIVDWEAELASLPDPIVALGNPPWVTSAQLGRLGSSNLPTKQNSRNLRGLDAITGKSNFDISEWLQLRLVAALSKRQSALAMLCKTSVARRVLAHCWEMELPMASVQLFHIDANSHFDAAVDACLLVLRFLPGQVPTSECSLYPDLSIANQAPSMGYRDRCVIANVTLYDKWSHLGTTRPRLQWRSGIKHDCRDVMELTVRGDHYTNPLGEALELESDYLYPMLKATELARGRLSTTDRVMLVPQRAMGEDTAGLRHLTPRTWAYLERHASRLDARASSIYRQRARFSVFGVGPYSFQPWKVGVSALHKEMVFQVVGPRRGKPVVFDDTCYLLGLPDEASAQVVCALLRSEPATEFFLSRLFTDSKRPVTTELLNSLDLLAVARELGREDEVMALFGVLQHSVARDQLQTKLF